MKSEAYQKLKGRRGREHGRHDLSYQVIRTCELSYISRSLQLPLHALDLIGVLRSRIEEGSSGRCANLLPIVPRPGGGYQSADPLACLPRAAWSMDDIHTVHSTEV